MIVVTANELHVAYLSEFGGDSFIRAYERTLPQEELRKYVDVAFSESTILGEIDEGSATYFVCQDATGTPCGYAKLVDSHSPDCIDSTSSIELQRLYVDDNHKGCGVGKLLESHAVSFAHIQNICHIWLRVWDGNRIAQDIYRRWDYSVVGSEPYQVGEDERTVLVMLKSLSRKLA